MLAGSTVCITVFTGPFLSHISTMEQYEPVNQCVHCLYGCGCLQAIRISLQQQQRVVWDIPEAATLSPTEAEFRDFCGYIKRIAPDYAKEGIVKIVLPESAWFCWKLLANVMLDPLFSAAGAS